jgi:hypothetical protein
MHFLNNNCGIAVDTLSTLGHSSPHPFSSVVRDWGPESYRLSSPFSLPRLRLGSGVVIPNRWGGVGIYPYPSFATAIAN